MQLFAFQTFKYNYDIFDVILVVQLDRVRFVNNEMLGNWYRGLYRLYEIQISTRRLNTIHANAFNGKAFEDLCGIKLDIEKGSVRILNGAFDGSRHLAVIEFDATSVNMPIDLFQMQAHMIFQISFYVWPKNISLNDMFANDIFRHTEYLDIRNVAKPQKKFRLLARANFTSFRRLRNLKLLNCGIEVITDRAFEAIAKTLTSLDLRKNRVKHINIGIFRRILELKPVSDFSLSMQRSFQCTCGMLELEVMLCPFWATNQDVCVNCLRDFYSALEPCGILRNTTIAKFVDDTRFLRIIRLQMVAENDAISVKSNFSSEIRMVFVDLYARKCRNCIEITSNSIFKCLYFLGSIDRLNLAALEELDQADMISVTAIPILYEFGARKMHTMTLRRKIIAETGLEQYGLVQLALVASFVGFCIGCGSRICIAQMIRPTGASEMTDLTNEYEYCNRIELDTFNPIEYVDYDFYDDEPHAIQNLYI